MNIVRRLLTGVAIYCIGYIHIPTLYVVYTCDYYLLIVYVIHVPYAAVDPCRLYPYSTPLDTVHYPKNYLNKPPYPLQKKLYTY